jgi:hypothetical protein
MDEIEARVREMIRASDIPADVAAALQDSLRYFSPPARRVGER